ncbi:MAG: TROVE domain-containing protein [Reyranella sp.]|uniref:TROVE domain-containing protein n=1 Tax=Reyranella sp. TaxID=1929291 RepID=UPI003D09F4D8
MQLNAARNYQTKTHGGTPAFPHLTPIQQLRRSVLSCLLWESEFYEDGRSIADCIVEHAKHVDSPALAALAIEARSQHNLRHVPLLLLSVLAARGGKIVGDTIYQTIQRADELSEFLSVYWRNGKAPLSKQVKLGLARAFRKFDAYALAKYNRDKAIKLRDVLFLCHAKPKDDEQAALWKSLVDGSLPVPDTWEVALSGGADKRQTWERLIAEGGLGYLALLRNLRNMTAAGVDTTLIRDAVLARKGAHRVLPFRYVAAARACPQMEPALDQALSESIAESAPMAGKTIVLVDVSGSMDAALSAKSDLKRIDAAAALASLIHGDLRVFTFSERLVEIAPRRGMAGVDAVIHSQSHGSTRLAESVAIINQKPHDRLIVITDEQATDGRIPDPVAKLAYMVNVASYKNGVGYGRWTHLDGFSEGILRWIHASEDDASRTH